MLISTALLLDSIIRNSVCTPAKIAVPPGGGGLSFNNIWLRCQFKMFDRI
jgi:hypothetical protein